MTSPITCHVLDSTLGKPGAGVQVKLEHLDLDQGQGDSRVLATGETNSDGRCTTLLPQSHSIEPGVYRMTFETSAYFAASSRSTFYPRVEILFDVGKMPDAHYHIPLLLSPFGYTTYRGS